MPITHEDITKGIEKQMNAAAAIDLIPKEFASQQSASDAPAPPAAAPAASAPAESTSPASQPSEKQVPEFDFSSLVDEKGMILGKYKEPTDLRDAYWHAVNSGSALAQENDRLRAQLAATQQGPPQQSWNQAPTVPGPLPGSEPRVNPVARDYSQERTVAKLAEELGVDPRVVGDAFQTIAGPAQTQFDPTSIQQIVRDAVRQEIAPIQAQNEVDAFTRQHPEVAQHRQELEMFVRTAPPEVQRDISDLLQAGNQAGAYRLAWSAYQDALRSTAQTQLTAQSQAAEAERLAARGAASMPSAPQGTPPHAVTGEASAASVEHEQNLIKRAQEGDLNAKREYALLKFGNLPGLQAQLAKFAPQPPVL